MTLNLHKWPRHISGPRQSSFYSYPITRYGLDNFCFNDIDFAQLTLGQNHDTPSATKDVFVFVMFAHKKDKNWTRLHKQTEKTLFAYKNAFCAGNKTQVAEIIINNTSHIIGLWIFFPQCKLPPYSQSRMKHKRKHSIV